MYIIEDVLCIFFFVRQVGGSIFLTKCVLKW